MRASKHFLAFAIAAMAFGLFGSEASAQPVTLRFDAWATNANGFVHDVLFHQGIVYIGGEFTAVSMATGNSVMLSTRTAMPFPLPKITSGATITSPVINAVVSDGAGGWFVGGNFDRVDNFDHKRLVHILANGTLDVAWKPDPDNAVLALALRGATLYVGGEFANIGGQTRTKLAALYAATGQAVPEWNPKPDGPVRALAVDGSLIYVGGDFFNIVAKTETKPRNRIAAIDSASGDPIPWNPDITGTNAKVNAIAVSGTTVYVGGTFNKVGAQTRNNIAAINAASGNPLPWDPNASGGAVLALAVSGSTVYAGGSFTSIGADLPQQPRIGIAALEVATGKVVPGWTLDATANTGAQINALAINGSTLYVGGKFTRLGSGLKAKNNLAALNAQNGTELDWTPDLGSSASGKSIFALAVSGSTVYAGGDFSISVSLQRNRLAAFEASTGRPAKWNPDVADGAVRVLAVSGSRMYIGGTFTKVGGKDKKRLAALDLASGNPDETWSPDPDGEIRTIDVAGPTVYVGGSFSSIGKSKRLSRSNMNVAALDATEGNPAEWNPLNSFSRLRSPAENNPPPPLVSALVVRGAIVFIGGNFTKIGGADRNFLAALDANGNLLDTWNPEISSGDSVRALAISGSKVYAGGKFALVKGMPFNSAVAIDAASGIPSDWDPNVQAMSGSGAAATFASGVVRTIKIDGATVLLGGTFSHVKGEPRNNAAAVNINDASLQTWHPNVSDATSGTVAVNAIETGASQVFLGGNFTRIAGAAQNHFAPLGETPLNPVPTLASLSQAAGNRLQTLEVIFAGENFVDDVISSVNAGNGIAVNSITVENPTSLKANLAITETAATGRRYFSVTNNPPGGGTSSLIPFAISNPVPALTRLEPARGQQGQTINNIEVTGSNFISGVTTISFGPDIIVYSPTVTGATRLTASIIIGANAAVGNREVSVTNAAPGGGPAPTTRTFAVEYPRPTLSSISPASGNRLQTLDVNFTGAGFVMGATTVITGDENIKINSTTVNSPTSLKANLTITAQAAAGKHNFSVKTGGGFSEDRIFTVNNPAPTLTRLDPDNRGRGQTHNVVLFGTNFIKDLSTASFGPGIRVKSVTVNSDSQITANIFIPLNTALGSRTVSVTNAGPGGGTDSLAGAFAVVNPRPGLTSITPPIGSLTQRFYVDFFGANFIDGVSRVDFGEGITINRIVVFDSTQIAANITIEGWAPLGARDVAVINAGPGGGTTTLAKAFAVSNGPVVLFSVPQDLRGAAGDTVEIPLHIDPAARQVGSFDAKLSFNPEVLAYIDFRKGPILGGAVWMIDVNKNADDAIQVGAYAEDTALSQADTAVVFRFLVKTTAQRGAAFPLELSKLGATNLTANALPVEGVNGFFTVPAEAKISGSLFYFANKQPLAGDTVEVKIDDPTIRLQVSDENGHFEFTELPLGSNVLLAPRQIAGNIPEKTITAGDAGKAFKGRAGGPAPLTGYESLAAEVTGDCQLTSGDALAILKRATGNLSNFRRFGMDDWRFVDADFPISSENWCDAPNSRLYAPLLEDQTGQDFIGIILGDVNGIAGDAPGKAAGDDGDNNLVVAVSDPALAEDEQLYFTVDVSAADRAYNSFDLTLTYETAAIRVANVALATALKPEDWQMDWNGRQPGVLRIAGFSMSAAAIKGKGQLVTIQAKLARPAKEGEPLNVGVPSALFGIDGNETRAQIEARNLKIAARPPQAYALEQNYPNPFARETPSSKTVIKYSLPEAGAVTLRIYDVLGHPVRKLVAEPQKAGTHTVVWNGRKDDGKPAAAGVYLYRLEAGAFTKTKKLILQK